MILLIDNYDSFSYNLFQMIGEINPDIKVIRNNEITVEKAERLSPEKIIISPVREDPRTREFVSKRSCAAAPVFRYWAFAWDIRRYAGLSAAQ